MNSSEEGKQIGRAKSEKTTGLSNFRMTIELPSTGDLTIPTIRCFCSHGARLPRRTLANLAIHLDLPCLEIQKGQFQQPLPSQRNSKQTRATLPLKTRSGCHDPLIFNQSSITNMLSILV